MGTGIVGWAHLPFGKHADLDLESRISLAAKGAMAHAGIDGHAVDGIWIGNLNGRFVPDIFCSSLVMQADEALRWKPATRVENACASGAAAIYSACDAIESGRASVALVIGAESMTNQPNAEVTRILSGSSYYKDEGALGLTFPGIFAEFAKAYFGQYGDRAEVLARIAAKNHANGVHNPYAQMRKDLGFDFCKSVSEKNPIIAAPLRKTDCSLVSDGAAALVVALPDVARAARRSVRITGRAHANDHLAIARRTDALAFDGAARAFHGALREAGIALDDLDLLETHDCFTIAELLQYEAFGIAAPGKGAEALADGRTDRDGLLPVNRSGGLKAKGHPLGATGVSQHVMAAMQLTGEAGDMQLSSASRAAVFNMGGAAVANYATVLEAIR